MIAVTGAAQWAHGISRTELFEFLREWLRVNRVPGADGDLFVIQSFCEDSGELIGQVEVQTTNRGEHHVAG